MTFHYRDPFGCPITARAVPAARNEPLVAITVNNGQSAYIPLDRIEEFIAGVRDTARQAAGNAPPPAATLRCNWARLGHLHTPHDWEPQPGMEAVHCPGDAL
ncbi:hypothetical protein [Streptomyces sp. NPDC003877]